MGGQSIRYTALGVYLVFFKGLEVKFSQPYFQPNFFDKTTSVAKIIKNIRTLLPH
jgi:hypothetical protein